MSVTGWKGWWRIFTQKASREHMKFVIFCRQCRHLTNSIEFILCSCKRVAFTWFVIAKKFHTKPHHCGARFITISKGNPAILILASNLWADSGEHARERFCVGAATQNNSIWKHPSASLHTQTYMYFSKYTRAHQAALTYQRCVSLSLYYRNMSILHCTRRAASARCSTYLWICISRRSHIL